MDQRFGGSSQTPPIDSLLVSRLIAAQFPQWADLQITRVDGGWDNRTFRLGPQMSARLPSAEGYVAQVAKEHRWLPVLAAQLPLPVPHPLAMGAPGEGYPWTWSVYGWLDGTPATAGPIHDLSDLATSLAGFLLGLQHIDTAGGPPPGRHSAFRGGPLDTYDSETREAIATLVGHVDRGAATAVWDAGVTATWHGPPVWFHGDVAAGNILMTDGRLGAVIDFGCSGVGDPACDLAIAWTMFSGESRAVLRERLSVDAAAWARGRGWALWKALIIVAEHIETKPAEAAEALRVLDQIFRDHDR